MRNLLKKVKKLRDRDQNLKEAKRILEEHLKTSNTKERMLIIKKLAEICLDLGEIQSAEKYFNEAIFLAEKLKENLVLADLYRKYGYFANKYHKNGAQEGLGYVATSLKICNCHPKDPEFLKVKASALAAKGNILYDDKRNKEALKVYQEALKICSKIGFSEREVTLLGDIANIYISEKELRKAEKFLKEMLLKAVLYYKHSLPAALCRLGKLKLVEKKPEEAQMWAELSLIVSQHGGWKREEAEAFELLGEIEKKKKNLKQAKNYLKKALKIYSNLDYYQRIETIKEKISKL